VLKKDRIAIPADPNDPEDFDVTEEALEQGLRCRCIRLTRVDSGLSQLAFARKFRIPVGTLRDWEQSRSMPPDYVMAYFKVIARHPELVVEALAAKGKIAAE
jgi:putative transcriptional regulator